MSDINWPTAAVIFGLILSIVQLLRDFLSGKYSKDSRGSNIQNLRVNDEKWKTKLFVQLGILEKGQKHLEEGQARLTHDLNRFKDAVQTDVNNLTQRIDRTKKSK